MTLLLLFQPTIVIPPVEISGGFSTTTDGIYNPVFTNVTSKWRNTKQDPYKTEEFEMGMTLHLRIISNKERSKKFKLPIYCAQVPLYYNDNLQINQEIEVSGFTLLSVIKSCLDKLKAYNIHILQKLVENNVNTININTMMDQNDRTPIHIKMWTSVKNMSKLGALSWLKSNNIVRITDSTYILEDIGNVNDIEMLEIIGEINAINR